MANIPRYEIKPTHANYDDETIRAVGEFFLECASAEVSLLWILSELQAHPNEATLNGLSAISGTANKIMLEKISASIAIIAPQHHDELERICTKIRKIFDHRNNIAHSTALLGEGAKLIVVPLKLRSPIKLEKKIYHHRQLGEYSDRLRQLVRHLGQRLRAMGLKSTPELSAPTFLEKECSPFPDHPPLEAKR